MKNIEIKIFKETRMVELNKFIIGNDGENLQGNLVFTFDEFVDGQARLEYVIDGKKNYIVLEKVGETYQVPVLSVITKKGQIDMQVVVTQGTEDVAIFKSNLFYLTCNASINAEIEQPDEYLQWIEVANAKLNEIDNLDIDAVKENGVATITITKKDGTQQSVNLFDAEGAVTNYELLENLPSVGGVELVGNKTLEELGIQEKGNYLTGENDPLFKQSASYGITSQDIKNWNNKSEFSGNYDDLNGKLTKTSELINDSGFISEIPNEYITEEELKNKKYLTTIPSEYVTETELNEKGYLTEHQSLDHLQEKLKSGENIKTINGIPVLGSGNINISGGDGVSGENGATFIPSVNEDGIISWTNDKNLENPKSVNIKGPQGENGANGTDGIDGKSATIKIGSVITGEAGTEASVVNSGTETDVILDFVIPQGEKGADGSSGSSSGGSTGSIEVNFMAGATVSSSAYSKFGHSPIPLPGTPTQIGNRLTLSGDRIVVGAGVHHVRLHGFVDVTFKNNASGNQDACVTYCKNESMAFITGRGYSGSVTDRVLYSMPMYVLEVQEGDALTVGTYVSSQNVHTTVHLARLMVEVVD